MPFLVLVNDYLTLANLIVREENTGWGVKQVEKFNWWHYNDSKASEVVFCYTINIYWVKKKILIFFFKFSKLRIYKTFCCFTIGVYTPPPILMFGEILQFWLLSSHLTSDMLILYVTFKWMKTKLSILNFNANQI